MVREALVRYGRAELGGLELWPGAGGAQELFNVSNYDTTTAPEVEYYFVVEPSDERLIKLGLHAWPQESGNPL